MKENKLRRILSENGGSISTRISSRWATITELAAYAGCYDYIEYLAEYAPLTVEDYENLARTCELHDMGSIVKVDFQNRAYVAQKAMACGIQGVLFTDCKTPGEVEESIYVTMPDTPKYGGRFGYPANRWIGYQPNNPQLDYADMVARSVRLFMIEKKEAVDRIEEICKVPGVDMIQFGPSDYSMNCGYNAADPGWIEERKAAERHCIRVALANGVQPRCEIMSPEEAVYYKELGVKHFSLGDQVKILRNWLEDNGRKLKAMVKK